nr:cytochrome c biogenesis CcmF C-terminal-like mitochondrial protein [Tanacetum cinerariifolium]
MDQPSSYVGANYQFFIFFLFYHQKKIAGRIEIRSFARNKVAIGRSCAWIESDALKFFKFEFIDKPSAKKRKNAIRGNWSNSHIWCRRSNLVRVKSNGSLAHSKRISTLAEVPVNGNEPIGLNRLSRNGMEQKKRESLSGQFFGRDELVKKEAYPLLDCQLLALSISPKLPIGFGLSCMRQKLVPRTIRRPSPNPA